MKKKALNPDFSSLALPIYAVSWSIYASSCKIVYNGSWN